MGKNKKPRNRDLENMQTKHHKIPQSRCESLKIQKGHHLNIILLKNKFHSSFHNVFSNKTPSQQLDLLFQINQGIYNKEAAQLIKELHDMGEDIYTPRIKH